MDPQHTEQTARLERDIQGLGNRFDRHLEIYAQNGKELAGVKAELVAIHNTLNQQQLNYDSLRIKEDGHYKDNQSEVTQLKVDVSKLAVKVAAYATLGSAVTSSIAIYLIEKIIT